MEAVIGSIPLDFEFYLDSLDFESYINFYHILWKLPYLILEIKRVTKPT